MAKYLVLALALAMTVSCGKKKGAEGDGASLGDSSKDSSIGSQELSFDASGSDSGKIDGLNTIFFDFDRDSLSSESKKTLEGNAKWIKDHSSHVIQVEGHCDARGSIEYNLALGERRAKATKSYLAGMGVDPKQLTIISYGEEKPLVNKESEDAWAKNRRANFLPIGR